MKLNALDFAVLMDVLRGAAFPVSSYIPSGGGLKNVCVFQYSEVERRATLVKIEAQLKDLSFNIENEKSLQKT